MMKLVKSCKSGRNLLKRKSRKKKRRRRSRKWKYKTKGKKEEQKESDNCDLMNSRNKKSSKHHACVISKSICTEMTVGNLTLLNIPHNKLLIGTEQ